MPFENGVEARGALGLADVPGELAEAARKTSKFGGVFGIRVFDAAHHLINGVPIVWSEDAPPADDWARLAAGQSIAGPAIIEQEDTTTVVLPGWTATVDLIGNLVATYAG